MTLDHATYNTFFMCLKLLFLAKDFDSLLVNDDQVSIEFLSIFLMLRTASPLPDYCPKCSVTGIYHVSVCSSIGWKSFCSRMFVVTWHVMCHAILF